jgi:hypothetical protein
MASTFVPQTGRLDRHVRRSVLHVGEGVSRHRISWSLEEALRLAALPGEEEGRIYCFRRISFSGVPADANRRVWMEQVQQVLGAMAQRAVHASHLGAHEAEAVYFNNLEEALEMLLRGALRTGHWTAPPWFAASVLGAEQGSSYAAQIPVIFERLRQAEMAPAAAASILFAALGDADPVPLLTALPAQIIREWLAELETQTNHSAVASPLQFSGEVRTALQRAAAQFGWKDAATVWLAAQAVLAFSPSAWNSGIAVRRARATLRLLEEEQRREPVHRTSLVARDAARSQLIFDDDAVLAQSENKSIPQEALRRTPSELSTLEGTEAAKYTADVESAVEEAQLAIESATALPVPPSMLGESTQSAGLYFLLNALRWLGIAAALDGCPALAEADLATHIVRKLAREAGVVDNDPILLCLQPSQPDFALPEELLANPAHEPHVWPRGFAPSRRAVLGSQYFLRVWTVAVKWWIWRTGRLTLRDVTRRYGRVWLTRTDLDVTFPLAAADLRIRRIGLDIDPGWLPWFGEYGRVVRFHYRDRDPEATA